METVSIRPHPGKQEAFLANSADICIYGGAAGGGKSWALLIEPIRHIQNGDFGAVILRKTFPEIRNEGGLWDESERMYPLMGAVPRLTTMSWEFPSGASIQFGHLDHESDKLKWHGSQICLIEFDELTHFTASQFFYMLSRNRSMCGVLPYVRATCNPDADSWVAKFIAWWIDQETGFPIEERAGAVRWFVRIAGEIVWADDPDELEAEYPEQEAKSVSFIPANLQDNPTLVEGDPGYRANLLALPWVDRQRLLEGNWKVRLIDGAEFPESYFDDIWGEWWPDTFEQTAMAVDPSKGVETGDPAAIVFVGLSGGLLWVDADIGVRPVPKICADTIEMWDEYRADGVVVESNMFQQLLGPVIDQQCSEIGHIPLPLFMMENRVKKIIRIRRLAPYLKNGKIRLRKDSPGCKILYDQLRTLFLPGFHDDGPDALEMAIRLMNETAVDPIQEEMVIT